MVIGNTFLFLTLFAVAFLLPYSYAQYLGETELYDFFIDENESHEITFNSQVTKFNQLSFDKDANSIIASVQSHSTLLDTIFVYLDSKSFEEIFSTEQKTQPTDILILLDGAEQEYEIVPTSQGEALIVWKFKNLPNVTEIELIRNPNANQKDSTKQPYISPLKQIKTGSAIHVIKCKDGKVLLYKADMTSVACVSEKTQSKLVDRGWGVATIEFSFENMREYLCEKYQGNWDRTNDVCDNITQKQCSLMRGVFQNPDDSKITCFTKNDYYFQQIEGKEISIEGLVIDQWGGSKNRYSFFTNQPYIKFNTGSGGVTLDGLNSQDDLNGKILRITGVHTERDLSIKVSDFEIIDSIFPKTKPQSDSVYDVTLRELTNNPDLYYNQTIRVAGMLTEHEHDLAYAGVGCSYTRYTTSDKYLPDFPSARQLNDGEKRIGVRIGSYDDLGKAKTFLSSEYKENPVEIQGLFVPNLIEKGDCEHVIHKSGYLLTDMKDIGILMTSSSYLLDVGKDEPFRINYEINGGTIEKMIHDVDSNSLEILLDSTSAGTLILSVPRDLVDATLDYCPPRKELAPDDEFFVLVDKKEVDFDEIQKTSETRTLRISFEDDSESIEIIGTCFV